MLALAKLVEEMTSIEAKDYIIELKRNRLYKWMGEVQCDLYDFFHSSEYKCPKEFKEWMIWKQLDQLTKHTMTKIIKRSELEERAYEVYLRVRMMSKESGNLRKEEYPRGELHRLLSSLRSNMELPLEVLASDRKVVEHEDDYQGA
ncbi:hypothetical protein C5167_024060 [Papaver somniferum]|uniref:Uncharacterized protein n=1 Tax=Papaver somniferum TaxID=3469 RepID=A0A4Y7JMG8_PAPSO|nr:hypothetical protein C5167_024060 [Papaver somniferum]